jgi:hypothetical protein
MKLLKLYVSRIGFSREVAFSRSGTILSKPPIIELHISNYGGGGWGGKVIGREVGEGG